MNHYVFALLFFVATFSVNAKSTEIPSFGEVNQESEGVSLIALIANPERYAGRIVRVEGALRLEFEGNVICLSKDDLKYRIGKNCLWVELGQETLEKHESEISKLNGKYVLVEGKFSPDIQGHFGMNSGAIMNITRVTLWER